MNNLVSDITGLRSEHQSEPLSEQGVNHGVSTQREHT